MPMEKVSLTLDAEALRQAREFAGERGLSAFVGDALRMKLQNERLRGLLADLDAEYGPVPDQIREEVDREWDEDRRKLLESRRSRKTR